MGPPQVSLRLGRVVARFVRAFAPERILLFGSYAKGTQHPGSDLDLLVIVADDTDPAHRARRARQLAADCFPPVDVVFATPVEVAGAASAASPFLASILESAIGVYEANPRRHSGAPEDSVGPVYDTGGYERPH